MEDIKNFHIPRWEELPDFPLYIEQVVNYIESKLGKFSFDEKMITSSMINNYVKHGIVKAPVKKKYDRDQIAYFIVICILKKSYSLEEVGKLLQIQMRESPLDLSYNYFCDEVESCIKSILFDEPLVHPIAIQTDSQIVYLLQITVLSVAQKICVQYYLTKQNEIKKQ